MVIVSARTGVHGGYEHEVTGVLYVVLGTRDGYCPVLKWLAEDFECCTWKFWQFVEEEDAIVCEAYLAGHGVGAASDEGDLRDGVVGCTEGALCDEPSASLQGSGNAVYLCGLEALCKGEGRQDAWQPPCDHALACARRPDHDEVVTTSGCYLECSFDVLLPLDIGEVELAMVLVGIELGTGVDDCGLKVGGDTIHKVCHLADVVGSIYFQAIDNGSFIDVLTREYESLVAEFTCLDGYREGSTYGLQGSVEAEFTKYEVLSGAVRGDVAVCHEYAECYGEVESCAFLAYIGWCEVNGDVVWGQAEAAIGQCGTDAAGAFLDAAVRQAHDEDVEVFLIARTGCEVYLDGDGYGVDAIDGGAEGF